MILRNKLTLALLLPGILLAVPAGAADQWLKLPDNVAQLRGPFDPGILREQVLLDRAGFSPGLIDARKGGNTEHARHAFQKENGLKVGGLDSETKKKLIEVSGDQILREYTIQKDDVGGPFVGKIPDKLEEKAKLDHLAYHSPKEALAEKFHMTQELLTALNPGKDFGKEGTTITVTAVNEMPNNVKKASRGSSSESTEASQPLNQKPNTDKKAARVVVDKQEKAVRVYDSDDKLIAFYPASPGSKARPAPTGTYEVTRIAIEPSYTVNPKYDWVKSDKKLTIAPGPNNPAGLVWIEVSAGEGYGIHGVPDPEKVGKTFSHGCIHLTNWDALALAHLVKKGTPVEFKGD
jgi:lipoprotein-anchoring transpeptidase ErfK/SrfK